MFGRKSLFVALAAITVVIGGFFWLTAGKSLPTDKKDSVETISDFGGEGQSLVTGAENSYNTDNSESSVGNPTGSPATSESESPTMTDFDKTKSYTASMKTSAGDIVISLNASSTPITVANFVKLAREKFYDNVIFHRVIKGFMIQGGDPTGTGTGGPGYKFADEPFAGDYTRGTVAMANSGPNTNGSQFFIMHADTALPKNYVIFGKVTDGLDTVDTIATAPTGPGDRPVDPVKILSVEITEN